MNSISIHTRAKEPLDLKCHVYMNACIELKTF